jgi:glucose-6-phosphate dehydrogenase assembly protein OpcA
MASSVTEKAARASRTSSPESIDADLASLWRELAHGDAPVARAVMSNLVVVRAPLDVADADVQAMTAGLPIDEVVARHPSRLIVLEHDRGRSDPAAPFAAAIGIVTFGPPHARYGVEQIVVRAACAEASLPSIVRRLIRGDLPTTVWWTGDLSEVPPLEALVTMGRQLVYDSRVWRDVRSGIKALAPLIAARRVDLADVNWRRLAPLRRALGATAGRNVPAAAFAGAQLRIVHQAGEEALAWLLAAWMLGGREADAVPAPAPDIAASSSEDAVLTITMTRDGRSTTAALTNRTVIVTDEASATTPLVAAVPVEDEAEAIAAELRTLSQDAALHTVLTTLVRIFGTGQSPSP